MQLLSNLLSQRPTVVLGEASTMNYSNTLYARFLWNYSNTIRDTQVTGIPTFCEFLGSNGLLVKFGVHFVKWTCQKRRSAAVCLDPVLFMLGQLR